MTAGRLLEIALGFVVPTAAVIWGLWVLWRAFRPGDVKMPSPVVDGIIGFLLIGGPRSRRARCRPSGEPAAVLRLPERPGEPA